MSKPTVSTEWASNSSALVVDPSSQRRQWGWSTSDNTSSGVPDRPTLNEQNGWQKNVHEWIQYAENITDQNQKAMADQALRTIRNDFVQTLTDHNYRRIRYVSGIGYVASSSNSANIALSDDGINWRYTTGAIAEMNDFVWAEDLGYFVGVCETGTGQTAQTSPDGITWTARTTPADYNWECIAYSPSLGIFVAGADNSNLANIMTSPDGITWTIRSRPAAAENVYWGSVAWSEELGMFVMASSGGASQTLITSTDGITWTIAYDDPDVNFDGDACIWAKHLGLFIVGGSNLTNIGQTIMTSPDGINWTVRNSVCDFIDMDYSEEWEKIIGVGYPLDPTQASIFVADKMGASDLNWQARYGDASTEGTNTFTYFGVTFAVDKNSAVGVSADTPHSFFVAG